ALGAEPEVARPDRDHVAAPKPGMLDIEPATRGLQLTQQRRNRSGQRVFEAAQYGGRLEIDSLRKRGAGGRGSRIGEPRGEVEHGPSGPRGGIEPNMQFEMLRGEQRLRTAGGVLIKPELIDRKRDAVGRWRQAANAGLGKRPV